MLSSSYQVPPPFLLLFQYRTVLLYFFQDTAYCPVPIIQNRCLLIWFPPKAPAIFIIAYQTKNVTDPSSKLFLFLSLQQQQQQQRIATTTDVSTSPPSYYNLILHLSCPLHQLFSCHGFRFIRLLCRFSCRLHRFINLDSFRIACSKSHRCPRETSR